MSVFKALPPRLQRGHPLARGLAGAWYFTGGSGLTAYDVSGYGNDGTLTGGPAWVGGRAGSALSFNGSTAYVQTPLVPASSWSGITIAAWVSLIAAGSYPMICAYGDNGTSPGDVCPQFGFYSNQGTLRWVRASDNAGVVGTTNYIGKGFHFFGGTGDKSTLISYEDGKFAGSSASAHNIHPASNRVVNIGRRYDGIYLTGLIDSVLIYNRALSAAEVALLYQMTGP